MRYSDKLKDPRWQRKRLAIFARDGFKCLACNATEKELQCHHLEYLRKREPWEVDDDKLMTLCVDCHDSIEETIKQVRIRCLTRYHCSCVALLFESIEKLGSCKTYDLLFDAAKSEIERSNREFASQ